MSIAAVPAAEAVVARTAAATGSRAAASGGSRAAAGKALPRDPGAHVAKLRSGGMDDAQIRAALKDKGYSEATAANVAPGQARTVAPKDSEASPSPSPAPARAEASDTSTSSSSGPSFPERVGNRLPSGGGGSGLLLGLVLYPLALAFLRDGPGGVRNWLKAKFLNQVSAAPATPGSSGRSGIPPRPRPGSKAPATPPPGAGAGAGGGGGSSF